jgi:hypothetical protein
VLAVSGFASSQTSQSTASQPASARASLSGSQDQDSTSLLLRLPSTQGDDVDCFDDCSSTSAALHPPAGRSCPVLSIPSPAAAARTGPDGSGSGKPGLATSACLDNPDPASQDPGSQSWPQSPQESQPQPLSQSPSQDSVQCWLRLPSTQGDDDSSQPNS